MFSALNSLVVLLILVLLFLMYARYRIWIFFRGFRPNASVPKLIHLIYIPWDKNQRLKENYMDFSQTFYQDMVKMYPDFRVEMWTLPKLKHFVTEHYPTYESLIFNLPRPTMIVDFLRLLLVYHYGGIYWQYESKCQTNMEYFLPRDGMNVKLFTEIVLSDDQCKKMANEPIRKGVPEEAIRVCNQVFSAVPKHPYLFQLFDQAVKNMNRIGKIQRDYDILYIGANAMMSQMYNTVGQYQSDIERVPMGIVKQMVSISSKGSWRTDKKNSLIETILFVGSPQTLIHYGKNLFV